jgi:hypothetical protein
MANVGTLHVATVVGTDTGPGYRSSPPPPAARRSLQSLRDGRAVQAATGDRCAPASAPRSVDAAGRVAAACAARVGQLGSRTGAAQHCSSAPRRNGRAHRPRCAATRPCSHAPRFTNRTVHTSNSPPPLQPLARPRPASPDLVLGTSHLSDSPEPCISGGRLRRTVRPGGGLRTASRGPICRGQLWDLPVPVHGDSAPQGKGSFAAVYPARTYACRRFSAPARVSPHDARPAWIALPSPYDSLIRFTLHHAGLTGAQGDYALGNGTWALPV